MIADSPLPDHSGIFTPLIGSHTIELDETDSTNRFAERLLSAEEPPNGTLIRARFQTAGQGQGNHRWDSFPDANILASIILYPRFLPPERQFQFNKIISLGVLGFIRLFHQNALIKWPNDILADEKKIAGILISHTVAGELLLSSIAGIGININQTRFRSYSRKATSLRTLLRKEIDIREATHLLCRQLDTWYNRLFLEETDLIDAAYDAALLGYHHTRMFLIKSRSITGNIMGVDAWGRLLIRHADGAIRRYNHGEVTFT